jgi:hypothetical protein
MLKGKNKWWAILAVTTLLALGVVLVSRSKPEEESPRAVKPQLPVNLIDLKDRPYVTLQPLIGRNLLKIVVHDLKKEADSVELVLEYDRNEGVLDAVLYEYLLTKLPYEDEIFLGSKSAGGHTTYHDDVIGGKMRLNFEGKEDYALEVPWRYDDSETSYQQLSTSDARFQLTLEDPIRQSKIIVMESPGLPDDVDREVLAGPYFVSTVGDLPETKAEVKIRLNEENAEAVIVGWDGEEWVEYETVVDGKNLGASGDLMSTYIVVKS